MPVTEKVATPLLAFTVAGTPLRVPFPEICVSVTDGELELTFVPVSSRISTVMSRDEPDARFAVELVIASCVGCGGGAAEVTVKVVGPGVSPVAVAVIVTEPAVAPVTESDATPATAVALLASPLTDPGPVCAKDTTVELSDVTTLSAASRTSTVSVRAAPEVRFDVDDVKTSFAADPGVTVKLVVPGVRLPLDALMARAPATAPVTVFDATPAEAVAVPRPVTEPVPELCANVTTVVLSELTTLSFTSRISAVSVRGVPEA